MLYSLACFRCQNGWHSFRKGSKWKTGYEQVYASYMCADSISRLVPNPTVARRNMSLPGESGQNLVEWRFRKEQARGKVIVFGRKLRVCLLLPGSVRLEWRKTCSIRT